VGQRLIDGVAKSMAEDFFKRFDQEMQKRYPEAYAERPAAPAPAAQGSTTARVPTWVWVAAAAVGVVAYLVVR
jgi:hypothetical protein